MESVYDIKFSYEKEMKNTVIQFFSTKQGGSFNVFSYLWQCFAWAATIGFIKDLRRPIEGVLADKPFNLNTMKNNSGENIANALLCCAITKAGTLDILKSPEEVIKIINEYANGGFHYIANNIMKNNVIANDFECVKQEIFTRNIE